MTQNTWLWGWRWAMHRTPEFYVTQRKMTHIFRVSPDAKPKVPFYPTRNPNASQWNIGCIGSLALGLCVGHVHFIFFVLISFALGSRRKHSFQWNMGLRPILTRPICSQLTTDSRFANWIGSHISNMFNMGSSADYNKKGA